MLKRLVAVLLLMILPSEFLVANDVLHVGKPADVGMSAEMLQKGLKLFEDAVEKDEIRGAVLLVARNGVIVFHEAVGWRNKEIQLPMQPDSLIRMASNTKAIVATAVMMLSEEGKLSPDDFLCKHLTAFENEKCREIRIRHLLSHTSGLRIKTLFLEPLMKQTTEFPDAPNLQLEVNRFADIGPEFPPGTTYSYNNPGYNTLGAVVEHKSGKLLEAFLTSRIYKPLGMDETTNHPVKEKFHRMCNVYERDKKTQEWKIRFHQNSGMKVPFVRGSGGMVSTAGDYAKFAQMFLNKGKYNGKRHLSKHSVSQMTSPQTMSAYTSEAAKQRASFYGFGWNVNTDGVFSHGGSEGTFAWIDPNRNLIGLIFTQSPGGKIPRKDFIELVNAACE